MSRTVDCEPFVQVFALGEDDCLSEVARSETERVEENISGASLQITIQASSRRFCVSVRAGTTVSPRARLQQLAPSRKSHFFSWYARVPLSPALRGLNGRVLPLQTYRQRVRQRPSRFPRWGGQDASPPHGTRTGRHTRGSSYLADSVARQSSRLVRAWAK